MEIKSKGIGYHGKEGIAYNNLKCFDYSALCSSLHVTYFTRGQGDKTEQIALSQGMFKSHISKDITTHS